jgi:prepilin peptidase CpaA
MRATEWVVVAWSMAVLASDLTARRIPNLYSMAAAALALAYLAYSGESVLGASWPSVLMGVVLALALTLPGYFAHWLAAGDVKLFVAISLLGGWEVALISFAIAGFLGAMVALTALTVTRYSGNTMSARRWVPFGAALVVGFLIAIWARA